MEPARCSTHGLIVGADGRCVICRRANASGGDDGPSKPISDTTWVFLFAAVALAAMGAYVIYRDPFSAHAQSLGNGAGSRPVPAVTNAEPPLQPQAPPVFAFDKHSASPTSEAPPATTESPRDAAREAAKKQVQIKMYSKPGDPLCDEVRLYLRKNGFQFTDFDVTQSDTDMVLLKSINPSASIPTLDVDGNVLTTINRAQLEDLLDRVVEARLRQASR